MSPPRTVDNYGIDASVRYARGSELEEASKKLLQESKSIPSLTEISVTKPYKGSELDSLLGLTAKTLPWGGFSPPPNAPILKSTLFSFQLIPSLGPIEKQEEDELRIKHFGQHKKKKKGKEQNEEHEESSEEEKEKEILLALFACLKQLNNNLEKVNANRNRYHKG